MTGDVEVNGIRVHNRMEQDTGPSPSGDEF